MEAISPHTWPKEKKTAQSVASDNIVGAWLACPTPMGSASFLRKSESYSLMLCYAWMRALERALTWKPQRYILP